MAIEARELSKSFRINSKLPIPMSPSSKKAGQEGVSIERKVFDRISFTLDNGISCVVGPNGSGKTTLIRVLSTDIPPDSGSCTVMSYDLVKEKNRVRSIISTMFQGGSYFFDNQLTVGENIAFLSEVLELDKGKIRELMEVMGVNDYIGFKFGFLSHGNKKKMALIRAIALDRPVLLLDEPTSDLDFAARMAVRKILQDIGEKKTILITTHEIEDIELCKKLLILYDASLKEYDRESILKLANNFKVISIEKPNDNLGLEGYMLLSKSREQIRILVSNQEVEELIRKLQGYTQLVVGKPNISDIVIYLSRLNNRSNW
jgi:ABC-type multidrug transport system, ATPase component